MKYLIWFSLYAQNSSYFLVDSIDTVSQQTVKSEDEWLLPNKKIITLRICLKDRSTLNFPIVMENFILTKIENDEEIPLVSDVAGCLTWSETIDFNYIAPEEYIYLQRKVVGTSKHKGIEYFTVVVNPWSDRDAVDLNKSQIGKGANFKLNIDPFKNLVVRGVNLNIKELGYTDQSIGIFVDMRFSAYLQRVTIENVKYSEPLNHGRFNLKMIIVEKKEGNELVPISSPIEKDVKIENGEIREEFTAYINRLPDINKNLAILIRLTAVGGPKGLMADEGMIDIPALTGRVSSNLTYLDTPLPFFDLANKVMLPDFDFKFDVVDFVNTGKFRLDDGSSSNSVFNYSYRLCISNPLTGKEIPSYLLKVVLLDENLSTENDINFLETNSDGCITSNFTLNIDYHKNVGSFLKKYIKIEGVEFPFEGVSTMVSFAVNPWSDSFAWITDLKPMPKSASLDKAKLFVDQVRYERRNAQIGERLYNIPSNRLDLELVRNYAFMLNPLIDLGPNLKGETRYPVLEEGKVHLKVMLLAPRVYASSVVHNNITDYFFIAGTKQDAEIKNGKLITNLTFNFDVRNLSFLNRRITAVVKMSLYDSDVDPLYFSFLINGSTPTGSLNVSDSDYWVMNQDLNIVEKYFAMTSLRSEEMSAGLEDSDKLYGEYLSLAMGDVPTFNYDSIESFLADTKLELEDINSFFKGEISYHDMTKFCEHYPGYVIGDQVDIDDDIHLTDLLMPLSLYAHERRCRERPYKYVTVTGFNHIIEVDPNQQVIDSSVIHSINVGGGIYMTAGSRKSLSVSFRYFSTKLGLKDLPIVGNFLRHRWNPLGWISMTYERTSRLDRGFGASNRSRSSERVSIEVEELTVAFKSKYKRCFLLKEYRPRAGTLIASNLLSRMYRVCDDRVYEGDNFETWYFLYSRDASTVLGDEKPNREQDVAIVLRGKANYERFMTSLEEGSSAVFFSHLDSYLPSYDYMSNNFDLSKLVEDETASTEEDSILQKAYDSSDFVAWFHTESPPGTIELIDNGQKIEPILWMFDRLQDDINTIPGYYLDWL